MLSRQGGAFRRFLKFMDKKCFDVMASLYGKKKKLVLVIGCTGTGKSDLGVRIAKELEGEVVNADSMQIYEGLDITTNKMPISEQNGIPHHLMSFLEPSQSTFTIHDFREMALKTIDEIHQRRKLPIVVGGTSYYVESIIYENYLIPTCTGIVGDDYVELSNDELYYMLSEIDQESATQVHRNNRSRVIRAINIFKHTGRTKTDFIREQREISNNFTAGELRFPQTLVFYLDGDRDKLNERLEKRVDQMVEKGLRKEIETFFDKQRSPMNGNYGISQSIGLKEFYEYLSLTSDQRYMEVGEKLFIDGCTKLKAHTRQLARKQRNWIKQRFLRRVSNRQVPTFHYLDTSEADFYGSIVPYAIGEVRKFLENEDYCSNTPNVVNIPNLSLIEGDYQMVANRIYHCDICERDIQGALNWACHLKGKRHKNAIKKHIHHTAAKKCEL